MRKLVARTLGVATVSAGLALGAAGTAAAQDNPAYEPYPSVDEQQEIWNEGGANLGKGAAQLVSGAVVGVPAIALDYSHELSNHGAVQAPGN